MKAFACCCLVATVLLSATLCQSANLLLNPGFEDWMDSLGVQMPEFWGTSGLIDSNSAYRSTHAHGGSYSLALGMTGTVIGTGATVAFIAGGEHYDFSVWHDIPQMVGMGAIVIAQYDGNDSIVGLDTDNLLFTFGWEQYTLGIDAEPTAVLAIITISGVMDTVFYDDAVFDGPPGTGVNEQRPIRTLTNTALLRISPNPCREMASIVAAPNQPGGSELKIYDTSGRLVRRYAVSGTGPVTVKWDGRDYASRAVPSGAYFVRLDSGSKTVCERITVIR